MFDVDFRSQILLALSDIEVGLHYKLLLLVISDQLLYLSVLGVDCVLATLVAL